MTDTRDQIDRASDAASPPSLGEVADLVKTYAQQQTLGPVRGAGRWLAMGAAGAIVLGIGGVVVILGLLRLVQTEWDRAASGSLSWLSYVIVLVVCVATIAIVLSRIKKNSLQK